MFLKNSHSWKPKIKNMSIINIPNLKMIGDYQYNYVAASILALETILPDLYNHNLLNRLCLRQRFLEDFNIYQKILT